MNGLAVCFDAPVVLCVVRKPAGRKVCCFRRQHNKERQWDEGERFSIMTGRFLCPHLIETALAPETSPRAVVQSVDF